MSPHNGTVKMSPPPDKSHNIFNNGRMKYIGEIKLSIKQSRKVDALEALHAGRCTNKEVAERLAMSVRQVQRLKKAFAEKEHACLVHGNTGRASARRIPNEVRDLIAYRATGEYRGTSWQHMSELFEEEEGISVSAKSVGRILQARGIKSPCAHKGMKKRVRRVRRPRRGELVQIDASPFDWLSDGRMLSLHGAIDDATSEVFALWLAPTERLDGYFHVLERMVQGSGVPKSIYMDGHTIFFSPQRDKLSLQEELEGKTEALTQFGTVLDILGVLSIHAHSPQAKGRIERLWSTLQKRLTVDLRIAGIHTIEAANDFLLTYIRKHDRKFSVSPQEKDNAFLPAPETELLKYIICRRYDRVSDGGSAISLHKKIYVAEESPGVRKLWKRGTALKAMMLMDDSIAICHGGIIYDATEISPPAKQHIEETEKRNGEKKERVYAIPAANHPWRIRRGNNNTATFLSPTAQVAAKNSR